MHTLRCNTNHTIHLRHTYDVAFPQKNSHIKTCWRLLKWPNFEWDLFSDWVCDKISNWGPPTFTPGGQSLLTLFDYRLDISISYDTPIPKCSGRALDSILDCNGQDPKIHPHKQAEHNVTDSCILIFRSEKRKGPTTTGPDYPIMLHYACVGF